MIILTGLLFGSDSIVGFIVGLNLVGIFLVMQSALTGTALKNAKEWHDNSTEENEADKKRQ